LVKDMFPFDIKYEFETRMPVSSLFTYVQARCC
jgi:hypothetical protein